MNSVKFSPKLLSISSNCRFTWKLILALTMATFLSLASLRRSTLTSSLCSIKASPPSQSGPGVLTNNDIKFWGPNPEMLTKIEQQVFEGARVLEIGPGSIPFSRATHFVDWRPGENTVNCDLSRNKLPFEDKMFDFVYCRHVLEDLYNPFLTCDEMSRVAKAGYVETPSPLAEVCRGIDATSPPWRGYHHHRYFVWSENSTLCFAAKYPIVEHLSFGDENVISSALKQNSLLWNTYYFWNERISWRLLQHDVDYTIGGNYRDVILKAVNAGIQNSNRLVA